MQLNEFLEQLESRSELTEGISEVMKKVSQGKELTDREEEMISVAVDAAKKRGETAGPLNRIMSKVGRGEQLSSREESLLGAALKAAH